MGQFIAIIVCIGIISFLIWYPISERMKYKETAILMEELIIKYAKLTAVEMVFIKMSELANSMEMEYPLKLKKYITVELHNRYNAIYIRLVSRMELLSQLHAPHRELARQAKLN